MFEYRVVELRAQDGTNFKVNGQWIKKYFVE